MLDPMMDVCWRRRSCGASCLAESARLAPPASRLLHAISPIPAVMSEEPRGWARAGALTQDDKGRES
ncbi:MAG: hypothetical protein BGO65_07655 [Afipia sp. 64-13]|nr:MAG: hypothetical protein BGO65_07655 [Afipia sp. 64-13]